MNRLLLGILFLAALAACKEPVAAQCQTRQDCTGGAACLLGRCQPCPGPCGTGELCLEGACLPAACGDRPCRDGEACVEGRCRAADCVAVSCPADQSCAGGSCYPVDCGGSPCTQGDVCFAGGCAEPSCVGKTCTAEQVCAAGECLPADCAGVVCAEGNACQAGRCVSTRCVGVVCADGTVCADGRCVPADCGGTSCAPSEGCVDGRCVDARCVGKSCPQGTACAQGQCLSTSCDGVVCAAGNVCEGGSCLAPSCVEVECSPESLCYRGSCIPTSCDEVACPAGLACLDGSCVSPACVDKTCDPSSTCRDGACVACASAETACADGYDEDCDGAADCSDPECAGVAGCEAAPPENTALPTISGTPRDGEVLTSSAGTWTGTPPLTYAYQWQRCSAASGCASLSGADQPTLLLTAADVGSTLRVVVTASNGAGSASATSAETAAVAANADVPMTILSANPLLGRGDTATFSGECSSGLPITVGGTESATLACTADAWTYTTATQSTDGSRDYVFSQPGNNSVTGTWVRDATGPTLLTTSINGGATFATTPILQVAVTASDASTPVTIRVAEAGTLGDCQSRYADGSWLPSASGALVTVAPVDGSKKVCAWAKDSLGNVSVIAPSQGTLGVDTDTIEYQAGNIPRITMLAVSNGTAGANFGTRTYAAGDRVDIQWTATDVEGLANDPISIFVSTDGTSWAPVVQRYGSLSGNPTSWSGSYGSLTAPSASFFRLKVIAWDQAGNSSFATLSDAQNAANWSVYAGSTDVGIGGSARSAHLELTGSQNYPQRFDVDPLTGAVFSVTNAGLLEMDPRTGLVSLILRAGAATNLPDDGPLPADPTYSGQALIRFDGDGLLYLLVGGVAPTSATIYQVDLSRGWSRRYLGPGLAIDGTATPATAFVYTGPFAFDESHSLYFLANCTPGTWDWTSGGTSTVRLLKVSQQADQTAGTVGVVAGNCVRGAPPAGGGDAVSSPLTAAEYPDMGSLAVWDGGDAIYYGNYAVPVHKILHGLSYDSDAPAGASVNYNPSTGRLYVTEGAVYEIAAPNLAGANGDAATVFVASTGTAGDCLSEGVDAAQACSSAYFDVRPMPGGAPLLFVDDLRRNDQRAYRLRFKDSQNQMRTMLGTLPFSEAGASRQVVRSGFAGIYYKQPGEPNQTAFPTGLYFLDSTAPLFGYVDPATDQVSVLWGNQREVRLFHPAGTAISASLPMGTAYAYDARSLTFDQQGLPWLRYDSAVVSMDADRKIVARQNDSWGAANCWETAIDGAPVVSSGSPIYSSAVTGTMHNLTLRGEGLFLLGAYLGFGNNVASLQLHDYAANRVTWMMGAASNAYSPDTPSNVYAQSLSSACGYSLGNFPAAECFTVYRPDSDTLYFSEPRPASPYQSAVRAITTPANRDTSALQTLFSAPSGVRINNFIFSPDHTQVFYQTHAGTLRCHDLTSGAAWCNDTDLGPPAGLQSLGMGPNSLTWLDASHLLVSNYRGEIYQYALP